MLERTPSNQQGVALFVTLMMLVAMTIAALSLVRIIDSGNIIAGNLAFRQATLQATDYGIEAARLTIKARTNDFALSNQAWPEDCSATATTKDGCQYFPIIAGTTATGSPAIKWESSPDIIPGIITANAMAADNALADYKVKYFIDRLCYLTLTEVATLQVEQMPEKCMAIFEVDEGANFGDSGGPRNKPFDSKSAYFRVTVRAEGPRGTTTEVQSIMYKPA